VENLSVVKLVDAALAIEKRGLLSLKKDKVSSSSEANRSKIGSFM
jgi:hypothetical protein